MGSRATTARVRERLRTEHAVLSKSRGIFREYVTELYYPAQELTRWQRARCTPLAFLVEYLVYRVDAVAEDSRDLDLDVADNRHYDKLVRYKGKFEALLRRARAHNDAVARQLDLGEQYVRLENKVTTHGVADEQQLLRLAELRSSDVRLLHAMTFAILRRPVDQDLLDLLWPVEVLADIGNDLEHYTQDVSSGQFNTYDSFVRLYGDAAPARLRAQLDRYEALFHERLDSFPAARRDRLAALGTRRYRQRTAQIPQPTLERAP
ncbi:hypothetical protein [Micromonospora rubida]|uniref:hypothetical protein n=1 Tax=Micromonospora rubida TaxID=2697657 RepID=UPI001376ACF3|nr:hypothetical protein [Micromonospora rubida]NBE83509.1 hypothetical protein [Micromonospora rubida]